MTSAPSSSSQSPPPDDARELVDRLVDGTLDGPDRAKLARAMERDPALKDDARSLEHVNAQLKAFFASSPAASSAPTVDRSSMTASRSGIPRRAALGLLAACLVIGGVVIGLFMGGPTGWARQARDVYREIEAGGFKPKVVCTTPEQFAKWTGENIGEALTPQLGVPGLELVGWNSVDMFSAYTGVLITKVDGKGVIVLLDRLAHVEGEGVKNLGGGLRAFPGTIGEVGVIEVTPYDSARVIPTIKPAKP